MVRTTCLYKCLMLWVCWLSNCYSVYLLDYTIRLDYVAESIGQGLISLSASDWQCECPSQLANDW